MTFAERLDMLERMGDRIRSTGVFWDAVDQLRGLAKDAGWLTRRDGYRLWFVGSGQKFYITLPGISDAWVYASEVQGLRMAAEEVGLIPRAVGR